MEHEVKTGIALQELLKKTAQAVTENLNKHSSHQEHAFPHDYQTPKPTPRPQK